MDTHCPHCNTHYQVDDDVLAVCGGDLRCYHCECVFNVLEVEVGYQVELAASSVEPTAAEAPQVIDLPPPIVELQHAPDKPISATRIAEPPVATSKPSIRNDLVSKATEAAAPIDLSDEGASPARHWVSSLLATFAIIALTLSALAQWAWLARDRLLEYPTIRPFLTQLGDRFDIPLPKREDPKLFSILRRDLSPDERRDDALLLRAVARNDSPLPQPPPALQLTLFDNAQNVVARRTFSPAQYLPDPADAQFIAPQQVFTLQLALADPGERASGFELSFY